MIIRTFFFFTLTLSALTTFLFFFTSLSCFVAFLVGSPLGFFSFAAASSLAASEGAVGRLEDIADAIAVGSGLEGAVVGAAGGGAATCADGSDGALVSGAEATTAAVEGVGAADGGASTGGGLLVFIADELSWCSSNQIFALDSIT